MLKVKTKVSSTAPIPFYRWDEGVLKRGKIVAVNVFGDESLVVKWECGTGVFQEFVEKNPGQYLRLSRAEQAEYARLRRAAEDAEKAVTQFEWNHAITIPEGTN